MDLDNVKEFNKSIRITWAFYIMSLAVVALGAWYVSDVHTRFSLQNEKIHELKDEIEYVNTRLDRKFERLENRVKELEKSGTD